MKAKRFHMVKTIGRTGELQFSGQLKQSVSAKLRGLDQASLEAFTVVAMPDFSLDHSLYIGDLEQFLGDLRRVAAQGGGEIPSIRQSLQKGGCAALFASGLGSFGIRSYLFGRTNAVGRRVLEQLLTGLPVNIQHVQDNGSLGLMTILEVGSDKTNIMIGDPQSMSPLGYGDLTPEDLALLRSSTLVGIFDWVYNRKGTDLAHGVCACAKAAGVLTYLDTGDPAPRLSELEGLCAQVIRSRDLDILSVNENELNHFASVVSEQGKGDLLSKAIGFKRHISARLDLHCSQFAASIESGSPTLVPAFEVIPCRTTGAGDSWNAANVFGQLLAWPAQERLLIANAAAAYYISDESGCQPTLEELADFIAATPLRGDGLQRMAG